MTQAVDPLQELRIAEAVRLLKARYFRLLDTKDWNGLAQVFCANATFDLRAAATADPDDGSPEAAETKDFVLTGRDTIVATIRDSTGDRITVHHGHCHEVWVDSPIEAHGIIAMIDRITNRQTGACVLEGYGHYHETYRLEDGAWRIWHSRLSRLIVTADLAAR